MRLINSSIRYAIWFCMLIGFCSCSGQTKGEEKVRPEVKSQSTSMSPANDPVGSGFFNGSPTAMKRAWLSFLEEGQFRIAQPEDFKFPPAALKLQATDIEKAQTQPYVGGDINRDEIGDDFAAIVVDKTNSDAMRFGLVVFTRRSRDSELYERQFLYSRRDLSKTLLEWWSGGLAVREYFDDGNYHYCSVRWDKPSGRYNCESEKR